MASRRISILRRGSQTGFCMKIKPSTKTARATLETRTWSASLPAIKLKRILVPTDFSEHSRKALHYAMALARQFSAELLLVYVIEPLPPSAQFSATDGVPFDSKLFHRQASKHLAEWREKVGSLTVVKTALRSGVPWWEIVAVAKENAIDLIILGTHGRTGLARLFIGSTAEQVVRHASCPVMVVREREHDFVATRPRIGATRIQYARTRSYPYQAKAIRSRKRHKPFSGQTTSPRAAQQMGRRNPMRNI
jgi:nucleotide-binding universal stress UspA family protein